MEMDLIWGPFQL